MPLREASLRLVSGSPTGVGSLPHRDASAAARFALEHMPGIPAIPSLPRRSPAESLTAQAVLGIRGITLGQYGSFAVDVVDMDPAAAVSTPVEHDAFSGFRAFVEHAAEVGHAGPVKWQFVGPVTLGVTLQRAGVPVELAFDVAVRSVRAHVQALHSYVATHLPGTVQVVVLDEPAMLDVMEPSFPVAPDLAIDVLSGALAALEHDAVVGVHCCGAPDWATLLAAGPALVSVPVHASVVDSAGHIARFLSSGGWIAWGAVPTDGPIPTTVDRAWRDLSDVWCELVQAGVDPLLLRQRSLITPSCGLGPHSEQVAARVFRLVREIAERVHGQAVAARFTVGA